MNEEYTRRLNEDYPTFFDMDAPITESLMAFGFSCHDGWYELIDDLCRTLQTWFEVHEPKWLDPKNDYGFKVVQVKEKFAGLRFYTSPVPSDEVFDIIHIYEDLSYFVCEECSAPGRVREDPWLRTLCDDCATKAHNPKLYVTPYIKMNNGSKIAVGPEVDPPWVVQRRERLDRFIQMMEGLVEAEEEA
jgi:hypothetical protein